MFPRKFVELTFFSVPYPALMLLVCCACSQMDRNVAVLNKENQIILELISKSKENSLPYKDRNHLLDSAYSRASMMVSDSLKTDLFSKISKRYYRLRNFKDFRRVNRSVIKSAIASNDSLRLAKCYWDLGNYYSEHKFVNDSAYYYYYKSQQLFAQTQHEFPSALMLYNISRIQSRIKDYIGSEVSISKAIPIFKKLKKVKNLHSCYNSLGIISSGLGEYEKAIFYFDKALSYLSEQEKKSLTAARIINNKGVVYKNQGKYNSAIENYVNALSYDSMYYKTPKLYAALLDNLAYSKFKAGDTAKILPRFNSALEILDSLSLVSGIITSKLHLSEYFGTQGDTSKGLKYAMEANALAGGASLNDDLLSSYLLLADLDKNKGVEYAKKHIALNDSLQKQERRIRNKFARIRFETDEFIDRNKRLNKERYWIMALLAFAILFAILGYVINTQRQRNKTLEFERMQQRANEEIYNLMLSQQSKMEEGSLREKKRISAELHDGVLGRIFGTRLTLGSCNDKSDPQSIKMRLSCLDELKSIEEEVRGISHEMSNALLNSEVSYLTLVTNLLETQSLAGGFQYKLDSDYEIDWEHVSGNMKISVYRIIQESVQNIIKYAQASNVYLNFEKVDHSFLLTIQDDGIGFDITARRKGIGLRNIKSRVGKLRGELKIESAKNKGTKIFVEVPLKTIVTDEETV